MELRISVSEEVRCILEQRAKAQGKASASQGVDDLSAPAPVSDAEFEADMQAFAEGTEDLPAYSGNYSRADIYFDHD